MEVVKKDSFEEAIEEAERLRIMGLGISKVVTTGENPVHVLFPSRWIGSRIAHKFGWEETGSSATRDFYYCIVPDCPDIQTKLATAK